MPTGQVISATELVEVRKAFDQLMQSMKSKLNDEDPANLERAYTMAVEAHKFQRRKTGEPYIFHPIEVARICFEEIGLGPTAVICALLHDVVEDTEMSLDDIKAAFGEKISLIVDGLTKLDGSYNDTESPQAENFKKVLSTLVLDVRVVLIKMADRLHNLRTIHGQPIHKQLKIAAETSYIYVPLAHRLGLYKLKTEFQDICLRISEPEVYNEIQKKLEQSQADRSKYINEFIEPLKHGLEELDVTYRVTGRSKAISSIYEKIKKKGVEFEEIYDLFAVRIIVDVPVNKEKSTCWQVYSVITDVYKPIPERLKDWVTTPKSNGYESLHTTVIGPKGRFVEVQIRSERMDDIAEKGFAAHWKYKGIKSQENVYDSWLDNVRDILDTQHTNALEFLNDFKTNLFSEEVYVFTPKGDMRILPMGATALDFAFDIHTELGYRATAIKVNNKLVPMGYKLNNGDQIQITTNKNQKPTEEWLKMVVTGKARSKIRSSMKDEMKKRGELGKEALERKLKNLKLDFEENIEFLVKQYGFKSRADLYYAIAEDKVKMFDMKDFTVESGKLVVPKEEISEDAGRAPEEIKRPRRVVLNKSKILVNGESGDLYDFSFANCCNPVPGDEIFGYTTSTQKMKIHRTNCPNATHLLANYGYRVLKVEWDDNKDENFVAELRITGVDSGVGVIQKLTNLISNELSLNMRAISIQGNEGYFEGKISIFVANKDQLNIAMRSIKQLDGISTVERVDAAKKNN
ncbi:MAG TPA: bifunctional (p)ppGpp synthetase/guanosine-3',5'-bis(diphosphate) 3'-pyrophosphohydrolase [Saprospiraceae bacterium]|nr:bifunctional (p)ppGpp synthetase/guanosine-3',5'-bis(diphosphate) 3'-pyrophosphohydrolase [Saprospiraceae bacterium]